MNFYTSVETRGNSILYRGYKDGLPYQEKIPFTPSVYVKAGENNGTHRVFKSNIPVVKKTFGSINDYREFVDSYKDINNFSFYGCSDLGRQFVGDYFPEEEIKWNYDLVQTWLFDIETKVEWVIGDTDSTVSIKGSDLKPFEIKLGDLLQYPRHDVLGQDGIWTPVTKSEYYETGFPQPEKADAEILLISMVNRVTRKLYVWSTKGIDENNKILKTFNADFRSFVTEKEMLKDFIMFWKTNRIDVISGWNSEHFDIPYIVNRMKKVLGDSLTNFLSPWGNIKERKFFFKAKQVQTFDISGIVHLDYLEIYKKFKPGQQESFKLDHIAFIELGERKVEMPCDTFKEFYQDHLETFVEYNAIDTLLLLKLEDKTQCIRLAMQLAYLAKCNYNDVVSAMRLWESIIYNYFLSQGIVEEFSKEHNERKSIVGAYVHEPAPGKYGWTASIDATSLYPSIMMQNNLSPECISGFMEKMFIDDIISGKHIGLVPEGQILSGNGLLTSKEVVGFIPTLVKRMFDLRKQTKNRMLDLKKAHAPESEVSALDIAQSALKIAANSFFGILALPYFKYYDYRLAEAITATGQVFIKHTQNAVNKTMSKALSLDKNTYATYLDTDSVYVDMSLLVKKHCGGKTKQEIVTFIESFVKNVLTPSINKELAKISSTLNIDDCKIDFKLENIGPSLIMVAKKRYLFDILYSEGVRYDTEQMKVMGIEIVRSSTPSAVQDYLRELVAICLRSDEKALHTRFKEIKELFMKCSLSDIAYPRGVNGMDTYANDTSIYSKGTPIHVRGALLYNHHLRRNSLDKVYESISDGDKIKFIALKKPNPIYENVISYLDKLPTEFGLHNYIDYDMQFEKALVAPLVNILEPMNWHYEERITLDDFFT